MPNAALQALIAQLLDRSDPEATAYLSGEERALPRRPLFRDRRPRSYERPTPYTGSGLPQHAIGPGAVMDPPQGPARVLGADNPGSYASFADYVNALEGLRTPGQADVLPAENGLPGGFPIPGNAPQTPTPPVTVQSSPQALADALADIDRMAVEPWGQRPQGFLPGVAYDLRETLLRRQMERQIRARNRNAPNR